MAGVVRVLHHGPLLPVVGLLAFGDGEGAPQAAGAGVARADDGRAFAQEFDALAGAVGVAGVSGDDAVPGLLLIGGGHGHHLLRLPAAGGVHEVAAVGVVVVVEEHAVGGDAGAEVVEVFLLGRCPSRFGDGDEARQGQIFEQIVAGDVLTPERSLHAAVVGTQVGGHAGGHRHVAVGGAHVVGAAAGSVGFTRVGALLAVDVVGSPGGDDGLQAQLCGLEGGGLHLAVVVFPAHDGAVRTLDEALVAARRGEAFVPHDDAAALVARLSAHVVGELAHEVRLQGAVVRAQAQFLHLGPALGVAFPGARGAFVAADVYLFEGEDVGQLVEHVLGKLDGAGVGHVEHVGEDAAVELDFMAPFRPAAELGITGHGGAGMAGELYFGYHLDVALLGVGHELARLVLGIEVGAVRLIREVAPVYGVHVPRAGAHAADFDELRVFLDFDAPALVVGQVPVEAVHLVVRHDVEHALELVEREEVAAHVEHEAAVLEAGRVGDAHHGQGVLGDFFVLHTGHHARGEHLLDALEGVEESRGGVGRQGDALGGDIERVAFDAQRLRAGIARHLHEGLGVVGHRDLLAGHLVYMVGKAHGFAHEAVRQSGGGDAEGVGQHECPLAQGHGFRHRCEVHPAVGKQAERQAQAEPQE